MMMNVVPQAHSPRCHSWINDQIIGGNKLRRWLERVTKDENDDISKQSDEEAEDKNWDDDQDDDLL